MNYNTDRFKEQLSQLNIELTDEQIDQFIRYYELLVETNKVMNLTAITEYDEVFTKHFIDSISIVKSDAFKSLMKSNTKISVIDMGTGAGFPGLPIKIAFPNIRLTLADSLAKRIRFLDQVIDELELSDVETVHGRAEDLGHNKAYREKYDICVSRAVANIATLSEYCLPLVKKDGYFISYKTAGIDDELAESGKAVAILGGRVENIDRYTLPLSDIDRSLLIINKEKNTSNKYPRKAGTPGKEPLK